MLDRITVLVAGLDYHLAEVERHDASHFPSQRDPVHRFFRAIAEFVHYIAGVPEFREVFLDRIEFTREALATQAGQALRDSATSGLQRLAGSLLTSDAWKKFESLEIRGKPVAQAPVLPPLQGDERPLREIISGFAAAALPAADNLEEIGKAERVLRFLRESIREVRRYLKEGADGLEPVDEDANVVERALAGLRGMIDFDADHAGAAAAHRLRRFYHRIHPTSALLTPWDDVSRMIDHHGSFSPRESDFAPAEAEEAKSDCRLIAHVMKQTLFTRRAVQRSVGRFVEYCEWFGRERIAALAAQAQAGKEGELHAILNEFLFREGYIPLPEPHLGKQRPDTLAEPAERLIDEVLPRVGPQDAILIEAKQSLGAGASISDRDFSDWVSQSFQYARRLTTLKPGLDGRVYLVIFYDGKTRYSAEDVKEGSLLVLPTFVYLGNVTPSNCPTKKLEYKAGP